MDIYEKEYKIRSCDVDMFRRLRISQLFTFTQEAAIRHTEILGAGREKTLDKGFLWVITLQHAEIERLPVYDEKIKLVSWAGKTMHIMFPRYYEIYDEKGKCIIKGSAIWTLMDCNTRSVIFPEDNGIAIEGFVTGRETALPRPIKLQSAQREIDFTVPFSYSDINGHLTNTKYFDIAEDITSLSSSKKEVKRISVEYSGEARYADSFKISVSEDDNAVYLAGNGTDNRKIFKLKMEY